MEYNKRDNRDPLQGAPLDMPTASELFGAISPEKPPQNQSSRGAGTDTRAPSQTITSTQNDIQSGDISSRILPDLNRTEDSGVSDLSARESTNSENPVIDTQSAQISQDTDTNNNSSNTSLDSSMTSDTANINRSRTETETSSSSLSSQPQGLFDMFDIQQPASASQTSKSSKEGRARRSSEVVTEFETVNELEGFVLHVTPRSSSGTSTATTGNRSPVASSAPTTTQASPTINVPVFSRNKLLAMREKFKEARASVTNQTPASTSSSMVSTSSAAVCTVTAGQAAITSTVITTSASTSVSQVTASIPTTPVTSVSSTHRVNISQAPNQQGGSSPSVPVAGSPHIPATGSPHDTTTVSPHIPAAGQSSTQGLNISQSPVQQEVSLPYISTSSQSEPVDLTQDNDEENQPPVRTPSRRQPRGAQHQMHGATPPHQPRGGTLNAPVGIPSQRVLGSVVIDGAAAGGAASHQQQTDHGGGSVTPDSIRGTKNKIL